MVMVMMMVMMMMVMMVVMVPIARADERLHRSNRIESNVVCSMLKGLDIYGRGLVIHAAIDGFSRMQTFIACSNHNNRASSVLEEFKTNKYCPSTAEN
jgi:hypothetical protein